MKLHHHLKKIWACQHHHHYFSKKISRKKIREIVHQSMNNIIKIFMVSDYNQNNNSYEDYTYTSFTSNMIFPPNHVTIKCLQIFLCIFKKMIFKKINAGFSKLKKKTPDKVSKCLPQNYRENFFVYLYT